MARPERYFIGPGVRDKLRDVFARVDGTPQGTGGGDVATRLQGMNGPGLRFYRGTFTGSWSIGEARPIAISGSTDTVSVTNYCVGVTSTSSSATLNVIFGSVQGTASAVEIQHDSGSTAEITVLTGVTLTTSGLQFTRMKAVVMSTATASSVSIGVTACAT